MAVLCDPEGDPPGQRWFTVVLDDSLGPDSEPEVPVCVDCLLDKHPRIGTGLVIALSIAMPNGGMANGSRHRSCGTSEPLRHLGRRQAGESSRRAAIRPRRSQAASSGSAG